MAYVMAGSLPRHAIGVSRMSLVKPFDPIKFDQQWFYPQLLPKASVILLDGATGVGKTMLCAHLTTLFSSYFTEEKRANTVFLSAFTQTIARNRHLGQLNCDMRFVGQGNIFDMFDFAKTAGEDFQKCFEAWLDALITEEKPLVLVIDDIEEMIDDMNVNIAKSDLVQWWRILSDMAIKHRITIIVTRRNGMNLARHYGAFNRAGTEYCDFILTMHWHPYDPSKRVLSVAKNRHGPLGTQWHFIINETGAELKLMERHEHVRPSKCPQTWVADPGMVNKIAEAVEDIKDIMDGECKPAAVVMAHMKEKEYSERTVRTATAKMGLEMKREGKDWWYLPTVKMVKDSLTQKLNAARTRRATMDQPPEQSRTHTDVTTDPRTQGDATAA